MATNILGICCADKMIVGRWYKIISIPRYSYCTSCKVTYKCEGNNVCMIHDTVYIKSPGKFTVTATDTDGNVAVKIIEGIKDPSPKRTEVTYTPTTWEDFKAKVLEFGDNKIIKVPKGEYDFTVTADGLKLPEGTVINFGGSTLNVHHEGTKTYSMFIFANNHSGIRNARIIGKGMYKDTSIEEWSTTISFTNGYNNCVENIYFADLPGFNGGMGGNGYGDFWSYKPSYSSGRWLDNNSFAGYIDSNGELVESDQDWCMKDSVGVLQTKDNKYSVGTSAGWINTGVKIYDIAFYDADDKFIELRENQQFYRANYMPEGAAKFRLAIHMKRDAPKNGTASDDYCFTRMRDGNNVVCDPLVRNIEYANSACGGFSVDGQCQDVHFENIKIPGNGWKFGWSFDFEDGWQAQLNTVISHSQIGGSVVDHSVQGLTILSSILTGNINFCDSTFYPTVINSFINSVNKNECRGVVTYINSYVGSTNQSDTNKQQTGLYIFGELPAKDNRNDMVNKLSSIKKWYIGGELSIVKTLTNCTLSNTADTVTEGTTYTTDIIPSEGYTVVRPSIKMGSSNISDRYSNGKVTINQVNNNLSIIANAIPDLPGPFTVTYNLTNCTSDNSLLSVEKSGTYNCKIVPDDGYSIFVNNHSCKKSVLMGGVDVSVNSFNNFTDGVNVSAKEIVGDIVINCIANKNYAVLTGEYTMTKNDNGEDTGSITLTSDSKGLTVTPKTSGGAIACYKITGLDTSKSYYLFTNMANFYDGSGPWVRVNPVINGAEDANKGKSGRNSCGPITGYDTYVIRLYACNEKPVTYTTVYFGE